MQSPFRLSVLFLFLTAVSSLALAACESPRISTSATPTPTNTPRALATCVTQREVTTQCEFSDGTIKIIIPPQATPQALVLWNLEVQPTLAATPPPKSTFIRTLINLDVTTFSATPVYDPNNRVHEFNPALILTVASLPNEYAWMVEHPTEVANGKRIRMYVFDNQSNTWRALTTLSSITQTNTLSMTIGIDHLPGNDADCDTRFD